MNALLGTSNESDSLFFGIKFVSVGETVHVTFRIELIQNPHT